MSHFSRERIKVLLACCKNSSLILLIHKNDVKTKPGYKTDLKDAKTFKVIPG